MSLNVFNELMQKDFYICGITKRLTKKAIDNLFTIETKDFIRSSPDVVLVDASLRPYENQYLFTYKLSGGKNGLCHKSVTYISKYQLDAYFKEVKNS